MPSHTVHAYLDRLYFGKAYWKVHRRLDSAWFVCRRGHRRYWHDWASAQAIARDAYPGDENAVWAAWLHIETDEYCTASPLFRKELEMLAKADAKKRRSRRKKKDEPLPPEIKNFIETCKKLAKIQRLRELILS